MNSRDLADRLRAEALPGSPHRYIMLRAAERIEQLSTELAASKISLKVLEDRVEDLQEDLLSMRDHYDDRSD